MITKEHKGFIFALLNIMQTVNFQSRNTIAPFSFCQKEAEIINQEDAHKEEFIERVAKEFNV
jgi:hypothetical protein